MDENLETARSKGSSQAASKATPMARPTAAPGARRVLIGCSDPLLGDALLQVLRHHVDEVSATGLDIRCVMDGVSCLQQLELARPDLLIVSARLDKMSGAEVLESWQRAHDGEVLPVVVLSSAFGSDVPAGFPAARVLQVPCDNGALVEQVARAFVTT